MRGKWKGCIYMLYEEVIRQVIMLGVAILFTFLITRLITVRSFSKKITKIRKERDSLREKNEKANEEIKRLREEQDQIEGVQAKLVDGPFEIEEGGKIKSDNAFVSRYDGKWIVYPKESITRTENDTIVISYEEKKLKRMKLYKYVGSFNGMNLNPKKQ